MFKTRVSGRGLTSTALLRSHPQSPFHPSANPLFTPAHYLTLREARILIKTCSCGARGSQRSLFLIMIHDQTRDRQGCPRNSRARVGTQLWLNVLFLLGPNQTCDEGEEIALWNHQGGERLVEVS